VPFQEITKMHQTKQLAYRVLQEKVSLTQAAREAGVSRPTAYRWVRQAQEVGLEALAEKSRAPHRRPRATAREVVQQVLNYKEQHPVWGAKKIVANLWPGSVPGRAAPGRVAEAAEAAAAAAVGEDVAAAPRPAPVALRTVDRILARAGLVQARPRPPLVAPPWQRFERAQCNELWQMDFKGVGRRGPGYWPLSILDDHSRYCLAFTPVDEQSGERVLEVLWRVFGEVGLPAMILTDNGSCFSGTWGEGLSWLESQLWLLGIETRQGRAYHPQTQGKVERFHQTVQLELSVAGGLRQPTAEIARPLYERVVHVYNWERPHEALQMQVPGEVYACSPRLRPARLPGHEIAATALKRKVHPNGDISFQGRVYRISKGLAGQWVELREEEAGMAAYFAGRQIGPLDAKRQRVLRCAVGAAARPAAA
jgi:transposase InsO family protein